MKTSSDFIFRRMRDSGVVIPVGERSLEFRGMVTLNETGSFLWERMSRPVTRDELVAALVGEYDVDEAAAGADVDAFLRKLEEAGLLEK